MDEVYYDLEFLRPWTWDWPFTSLEWICITLFAYYLVAEILKRNGTVGEFKSEWERQTKDSDDS